MFMDLYEKDAATALQPQPNEAHSLPATGEAAFGAAWNEAKLFSQSVAGANARASVLQDYISEIRQKTGTDLSKELMAHRPPAIARLPRLQDHGTKRIGEKHMEDFA